MSTLQTRIANLDDLDAVAALFDAYRQFYQQPADPALARAFLQERMQRAESVVLLASVHTVRAIGFCQLYPSFCSVEASPIYVLYDLYVAPESRRLGAGRALLLAAEQLARAHGKVRMDLTTARSNAAAQAAYASLGWVRDEVFHAYSKHVDAGPMQRGAGPHSCDPQ